MNALAAASPLSSAKPVQISMFGVEESQERHQAILSYAIAAIQSYQAMHESAVRFCVALFACHQEFKASGETGWEAFCKANFASLRLSQGNIRSSVNAGRAISHYFASLQERGETADMARLESLSRSALIMLGEAPDEVRDELIDRVVQAADMSGKAPTAKQVDAEMTRLLREKDAADRDKNQAIDKLSSSEQALHRLNDLVRDRESQIDALRTQIDTLQFKLQNAATQTPVVVEEADPNSKARRNLEREIAEKQHQLTQVDADLGRAKAELEKVTRQASQRKLTENAIEELEQQVARIKAQWSDAYAQKVRAVDPHAYSPTLTKIANDMRFLADQLDPTLV